MKKLKMKKKIIKQEFIILLKLKIKKIIKYHMEIKK